MSFETAASEPGVRTTMASTTATCESVSQMHVDSAGQEGRRGLFENPFQVAQGSFFENLFQTAAKTCFNIYRCHFPPD